MARKTKTGKSEALCSGADDSTPRAQHKLVGLEPDNLLAFMALLGLLRALKTSRPAWRPRAFWDVHTHPWRPVLSLSEPLTETEISEGAAKGVVCLADAHKATGKAKNLKLNGEDFATLRGNANQAGRQQVLDALACEASIQEKGKDKGTLSPTPFAFISGQGHQHFLDRFRQVPASLKDSRTREIDAKPIDAALFARWQRSDQEKGREGFRWDPVEGRRYALRANNPSDGRPAPTQHGANCLAAVALALLPVMPIRHKGDTRVLTPMTRFRANGRIDFDFTWPLWTAPTTLATICCLLRHAELAKETPNLATLPQVHAVFRAERISVGKYFNVTPATRIA